MEAVQSPIGRVSWPFVFGQGDTQSNDSEPKYKLTLMLPKNMKAFKTLGVNPAQGKKLLAEVKEFVDDLRSQAESMAKAQFKKSWQETRWDPVLDGDEKAEKWDGNANFWLIRCKTKFKPDVFKPRKKDGHIADGDDDTQSGFYAGCWARAFVTLYTFNFSGNRGVGVGLGAVQKAWNDEPFQTGGMEFDDDIEQLDIDESDVVDFDDEEDEDDFS